MEPETQVVYRIFNGISNTYFRKSWGFSSDFDEATVFLEKPTMTSIRNTCVMEANKFRYDHYKARGLVLINNEDDIVTYLNSIRIVACVLTVVDSEKLSDRYHQSLKKSMCKQLPVV